MSPHLRKSLELDTCVESDALNAALRHAGHIGPAAGLVPEKDNGEN